MMTVKSLIPVTARYLWPALLLFGLFCILASAQRDLTGHLRVVSSQDSLAAGKLERTTGNPATIGASQDLHPSLFQSTITAIKMLACWETYLAMIIYFIVILLIVWIDVFAGVTAESAKRDPEGFGISTNIVNGWTMEDAVKSRTREFFLVTAFLTSMLDVAVMFVLLGSLAPIIFGLSQRAAWDLPGQLFSHHREVVFALIPFLAIILLGMEKMPIIGKFQAPRILVMGATILWTFLAFLDESSLHAELAPHSVRHFVPGFWFLTGILLLGIAMGRIGISVLILLGARIRSHYSWMVATEAVLSFIPIFIYGVWLRGQIKMFFCNYSGI